MSTYAEVLVIAIPFFLVLIAIEWWYGSYKGQQVNYGFDTISSLSSGMTNIVKDVLGLSVIIISYYWLVDRVALYEIPAGEWTYLAAFIGLDFAGYWVHRLEHRINIFWNRHIIHHSSEEFNLSCALRQSVSGIFGWFTVFLLPVALLGVPAQVIAVVAPLQLFAQFWYHTRLIGRMGFLEHIIVTPSHHRVHHAINDRYLDKNFAQIFIIWDKLFGTFQEELQEEPPVYGVKRQVKTWNPVLINFQHFWLLWMDAWRTRNWRDKLRIWFMPTGWRPADVEERYPVDYIKEAETQVKYRPEAPDSLLYWSYVQLFVGLGFSLWMLLNIADFPFPVILLYGGFIFVHIYAYTSLMDMSSQAVIAEFVKMIYGLSFVYYTGSWLGFAALPIVAYLLLSLGISLYFFQMEFRTKKNGNQILVKE
jgi:alkylglycerol monooxygenase